LSRDSAEFRDPKVFWYDGASGSYWVMVAVEALDFTVVMYRSDDLKSWDYLSSFGPANATGGVWECPDLFPLPLDGNEDLIRWVLTVNLNPGGPNGGSAGQYFVGEFDGVTFRSETTVTEGDQDPARLTEYEFGLVIRGNGNEGTRIGIRPGDGRLLVDRTVSGNTAFHSAFASIDTAPLRAVDGAYYLRIFVDQRDVDDGGPACLPGDSPESRAARAGGVTAVDRDEGPPCEVLVAVHFSALIPSQGTTQMGRERAHRFNQPVA
jgi:sucrose-6-phosphate hydrolase SacC (GH32 family)